MSTGGEVIRIFTECGGRVETVPGIKIHNDREVGLEVGGLMRWERWGEIYAVGVYFKGTRVLGKGEEEK